VEEVSQRRRVEQEVDPAAAEEAAAGEVAHPARADGEHPRGVGPVHAVRGEREPQLLEPLGRGSEVLEVAAEEARVDGAGGDAAEHPERDRPGRKDLGEGPQHARLVGGAGAAAGEHEAYIHGARAYQRRPIASAATRVARDFTRSRDGRTEPAGGIIHS
jgi:hypothetical protein